jgi:hypothetical protein
MSTKPMTRDERIRAVIRETEDRFRGEFEAHSEAGRLIAAEASRLIAQAITIVGIHVDGIMHLYDTGEPAITMGEKCPEGEP